MKTSKLVGHIFTALFILLALAALLIVLVQVTGWRIDTVLSGSMEPSISTGGMVIIRPAVADDIHIGDIIAFSNGKEEICHRVMEVQAGPSLVFITKGDANRAADLIPVTAENVHGKVFFSVPLLGYFAHFVRTPVGLVLTFLLAALLLIGSELIPRVLDELEKDKKRGYR